MPDPEKPAQANPQAGAPEPKEKPEAPKPEGKEPPKAASPEAGKPEQKPVVPERYDLKLPEGSPLDKAHVETTAAFAKERGLSNEQAQAILDREHQAVASHLEGVKAMQQQWAEDSKNDKEIGGEGFSKNVELAKRVVDKYGSESFRKALSESGLGNHPELVRFITRIGKAFGNDHFVQAGAKPSGKRPIEEVFYGKPKEE